MNVTVDAKYLIVSVFAWSKILEIAKPMYKFYFRA